MGTWRCATCHKLMVGNQEQWCRNMGHESPYDDEEGEE